MSKRLDVVGGPKLLLIADASAMLDLRNAQALLRQAATRLPLATSASIIVF
jgi:hypothetical protein